MGSKIKSIIGRQIFSERGHPGIETTVVTEDGATGVATVTAGISVGQHEVQFVYDGGSRWRGRGILAVRTRRSQLPVENAPRRLPGPRAWRVDRCVYQAES